MAWRHSYPDGGGYILCTGTSVTNSKSGLARVGLKVLGIRHLEDHSQESEQYNLNLTLHIE